MRDVRIKEWVMVMLVVVLFLGISPAASACWYPGKFASKIFTRTPMTQSTSCATQTATMPTSSNVMTVSHASGNFPTPVRNSLECIRDKFGNIISCPNQK